MKRSATERDAHYAALREASEREDLVMFINACFAATGQAEYYSSRVAGRVSIDFLHSYVLANYRTVYRRVLAVDVNDFNRALILFKLLESGAPSNAEDRAEEGQLISVTLRSLPANRVYSLFAKLRTRQINNRRSRAVVRDYLRWRRDPTFDAVKYRKKVQVAARHSHLKLSDEMGTFLFEFGSRTRFSTPLYDSFRRAHYSKQAVYELPYTVAEGFAARHGIPRAEFLQRIEPQMTRSERLRLQQSAERLKTDVPEVNLSFTSLTKLAIRIMAMSREDREQRASELDGALRNAAANALRKRPVKFTKIAAVLDRSRSSWGTRERRRRPLAVSVAIHYLLAESADEMCSFWTPGRDGHSGSMESHDHAFLVDAGGQTDLATPLLSALQWCPDNILIVSDGYENDPIDAVNQIVHAYQLRLSSKQPVAFVHANPVFDPQHFSPKSLGETLVTVGLRDAEDLGQTLGFARFAAGEAS